MNPGSEPERDDTGLPPVDIEIPDDARDLDRDVQAYYRELRAHRRLRRRSRWHRSLGRDSIVLPLLACCLILALITGTLLTVFTATAGQNRLTGPGANPTGSARPGRGVSRQPNSGVTSGAASPVTASAGHLAPATLYPSTGRSVAVGTLDRAMLVMVPNGCDCADTLAWLANAAKSAHATAAYLIFTADTEATATELYGQLPPQSGLTLAKVSDNTLISHFPTGIPRDQLTAILVSPSGSVTYAYDLSSTEHPALLVDAMKTG